MEFRLFQSFQNSVRPSLLPCWNIQHHSMLSPLVKIRSCLQLPSQIGLKSVWYQSHVSTPLFTFTFFAIITYLVCKCTALVFNFPYKSMHCFFANWRWWNINADLFFCICIILESGWLSRSCIGHKIGTAERGRSHCLCCAIVSIMVLGCSNLQRSNHGNVGWGSGRSSTHSVFKRSVKLQIISPVYITCSTSATKFKITS